mmetsp:Transcript_41001/g.89583  ORF Transcript_41001/g.89583 Transcript_41001/m.89583 type:complete len:434 (-) Transcript_41001:145-1446(-)|eukprot:CAMPEP_0170579316 /NCGR_PEP_ID=MMETSP0224-20130122/5920_1 /TAXON_ID=285029 /ORGANISM="Togula jolla, Strain CCCM 725" /LENGTH=433 /DNA_ID=CAMNT_0010902335 /DNA_START=29 /DNA_END=1330 /DNA_ORIENTATION=+
MSAATPRSDRSSLSSPGRRAADRVRSKNSVRAEEVRRLRNELLHRHLLKASDGSSPGRVANEEEVQLVAELLNKRIAEIIPDPQARCWYKLFNHLDEDCSGKISYWELEAMIRKQLKLRPSDFSEEQLQAIWRALDEDSSGLITCGEFGHFLLSGAGAIEHGKDGRQRVLQEKRLLTAKVRQELQEMLSSRRAEQSGALHAKRSQVANQRATVQELSSTASEKLRLQNSARAASLRREREDLLYGKQAPEMTSPDAAPAASSEEVNEMAELFNRRLAEIIPDLEARSWYKLFNHVDDNGSGNICYPEFSDMVRKELKLPRGRLPDEKLKALWRAIDKDGSGRILCGEFALFMRRGAHVHGPKDPWPQRLLRSRESKAMGVRTELKQLLSSRREELESRLTTRRAQVAEQHAEALGQKPNSAQQPWRSPRAILF